MELKKGSSRVAIWENGAERIYTALVKVGFLPLKCVLKSFIGRNEQYSKNMIALPCEKIKNNNR